MIRETRSSRLFVNRLKSTNMAACARDQVDAPPRPPLNCLAASGPEAQRCAGNAGGRRFYDCSYAGTGVLGAAGLTDQGTWRRRRRKKRPGRVWRVGGRPGRMMRCSARGSLDLRGCGDWRKSRYPLRGGCGWGGGDHLPLSLPHLTNSFRLPLLELGTPRTMTPPQAAGRRGMELWSD